MRPNRLGRRVDYRTPRSHRAATAIGATTRRPAPGSGLARLFADSRGQSCAHRAGPGVGTTGQEGLL